MKNALIFGSSSFSSSSSGYWNFFSCLAWIVDEVEVVVLEVRHLEVRREDRHAERDGVALIEDAVGLERLEDVAHGGRAALDRVDLERALRMRVAAHRPLQVLVHDLLVVHQHAVRHGVVVADDRVRQLEDELVGSKPNFFTAHGTIRCRKGAPGMSSCFASQASSRAAAPAPFGMPPTPGGRSSTRLLSRTANCPSRKNPRAARWRPSSGCRGRRSGR